MFMSSLNWVLRPQLKLMFELGAGRVSGTAADGNLLLMLILTALLAAPVWANAPEPTVTAALQDKAPVGKARLRVWGFSVYDATLYARPGFDAQRFGGDAVGG